MKLKSSEWFFLGSGALLVVFGVVGGFLIYNVLFLFAGMGLSLMAMVPIGRAHDYSDEPMID